MIWTPEPRTSASWSFDRSGETRRITEDGFVRVTEQNVIRIIDRIRTQWSIPLKSPQPWHLS